MVVSSFVQAGFKPVMPAVMPLVRDRRKEYMDEPNLIIPVLVECDECEEFLEIIECKIRESGNFVVVVAPHTCKEDEAA